MLKSEMIKKAQMAVISADFLADADKLDIIKMLMGEETLAKYQEEREKKESEVEPY